MQGGHVLYVTLLVPFKLLSPKPGTGFWNTGKRASFMSMPKASMDEYYLSSPGEDEIGFSGEPRVMQPVSISH
jgi:hypothetical protein